jgi:hypothetical protein
LAYRLINIALVLILAVPAGVSVQAVGFRGTGTRPLIRSEQQESRVEAEALGKRVTEFNPA